MGRRILKAIKFFSISLAFFATSLIVDLVIRDRRRKLTCFSRIVSFFSKHGLKTLGVRVHTIDDGGILRKAGNCVVVSNHLSYLDIFIISSVMPSVFVAKAELKESFILGSASRYGGSIFVDRTRRGNLFSEMEKVSEYLREGFKVVIFPEGTTSNGEKLLPFKSPFLECAIKAGVDTLLICLNYKKVNGECINDKNRDFVCYHGDMTFFRHLFELLTLESVDVELKVIGAIKPIQGLTRKLLALEAYQSISSALDYLPTNKAS
jgi:1-acyl-sn-glycerol-3-phosphate acyltransferase